MKDGGWIYVIMCERAVGEEATPGALTQLFYHAGFAPAGPAEEVSEEDSGRLLRGIFRKVEIGIPA